MLRYSHFTSAGATFFLPLFLAFSFALPASAQIEEIIVTAQKRQESLQDVPISVSALTGDMFDQFDVSRTDDLEKVFPNLGTNSASAANTGFAIRGVGTDNVHLSGQQSVGTYIDDVSIVSPFIGVIGVFDVDRVEVLRGPQNTLYGRNTTGGAVVWHTKQAAPGDGVNGYAKLRGGNGGLLKLEGAVGFDISDKLAARVSAMTDSFDGLWTNLVDGKDTGGGYERTGVRLNLVWDASENTEVSFTLATGKSDGEDIASRASGNLLADGTVDPAFTGRTADDLTSADGNFVQATAADIAANSFLQDQYDRNTGMVIDNPAATGALNRLVNFSADLGDTYQHPEDIYETQWDGVRLNFKHSFNKVDFASITSYDKIYAIEKNGQELTGFHAAREGEWKVWQQEFRLTSTGDSAFQWLAGLYFTDSKSTEDTWVANVSGAGGRGVQPGIDIDSEYSGISGYFQLDFEVTEALTLTGGLRYTDDKLSADGDNWVRTVCAFEPSHETLLEHNRDYRAANCPDSTPGRLAGNTDSPVQELEEFGGKLGLDYKIGKESLLWGSVSRGFKGGAYDNRALSTGDDPAGPEFLTAYEVGYKTAFANNTLQLNLSYYFYTWEDLQLFESYANPTGGGSIPVIVNVPEVEITGIEVDFKWAPHENWYLQGGLGTADSKVTDVGGLDPRSQAERGKEITNTPELTANLLGTYSIPIKNSVLDISLGYRYVSSMFYTFIQNARDESASHGYLNARVNYLFGDDQKYSIAVWGENLTEELSCSRVIWGPGAAPQNYSCLVGANYGKARYGVSLEAKF